MQHLASPTQSRESIRAIIERIRCREMPALTLPRLMVGLASGGNEPESIILLMTAIAQFTELDEQTEAISLQGPYERHDDETLARMVWQALLRGACAQHPASS